MKKKGLQTIKHFIKIICLIILIPLVVLFVFFYITFKQLNGTALEIAINNCYKYTISDSDLGGMTSSNSVDAIVTIEKKIIFGRWITVKEKKITGVTKNELNKRITLSNTIIYFDNEPIFTLDKCNK